MQIVNQAKGAQGSRRIKLEAYIATGIGALGIASTADAAVVSLDVSGASGINAGLASGSKKTIDWSGITASNDTGNMGAITVYNAAYVTRPGSGFPYTINGLTGADGTTLRFAAPFSFSVRDPRIFGPGESIGAGSYFPGLFSTIFAFKSVGMDSFGANRFMGFRVGSSNFNYGYIEVTWNKDALEFQILSAAYETDVNTPILAGALGGGGGGGGGEVPEPASGAIAALLMGGAALRQWRKKRSEANSETIAS